MKLKIGAWTIFIWSCVTSANVNEYSGEYLFDICIQKYHKGKNYLTGILTRSYGN